MIEETNRIITGETCFFRDLSAYHTYTALFRVLRGQRRTILSLPCSTGQEPYSIALLTKDRGSFPFSVHGIDKEQKYLGVAREGKYWCDLSAWSLLLPYYDKGWVEPCALGENHTIANKVGIRVSDKIQKGVSFSATDVLEKRVEGAYDVVFCLNFLYMLKPEDKAQALENILGALKQKGFLFLDTWTHPERYMGLQYQERQRRHNVFLESMPRRFGLVKRDNTDVYQKV